MREHTPGPWRTRKIPGVLRLVLVESVKDKVHIAEVTGAGFANEYNARLIAATPDMLGALKAVVAAHATGRFDPAHMAAEHAANVIADVEDAADKENKS